MRKIIVVLMFIFISCKQDRKSQIQKKDSHVGKFKYYKKNGDLDKELEFINLCGKRYLNQGWYFDKNGDTISGNSNYYKISVEKSELVQNEITNIDVEYEPLNNDSEFVLFLANDKVDKNFCSLEKVKLDTLFFNDRKLRFELGFEKKGKKELSGFILEYKKLKDKINNHNVYDERRVYFKIRFKVK